MLNGRFFATLRMTLQRRCSIKPVLAQVFPKRVIVFNQVDLFVTPPALELLLAGDGVVDITEFLVVSQPCDIVLGGELGARLLFVLPHPAFQVVGDADV